MVIDDDDNDGGGDDGDGDDSDGDDEKDEDSVLSSTAIKNEKRPHG